MGDRYFATATIASLRGDVCTRHPTLVLAVSRCRECRHEHVHKSFCVGLVERTSPLRMGAKICGIEVEELGCHESWEESQIAMVFADRLSATCWQVFGQAC